MSKIADKLIELRIATRKATMCESTEGKRRSTLSLKTKILYLIKDNSLTPADIMSALEIAKTNLALITSELSKENLMVKEKLTRDRREILYTITPEGLKYLNKRLDNIENNFRKSFAGKEEYDKAVETIEDAINTLSFMQ